RMVNCQAPGSNTGQWSDAALAARKNVSLEIDVHPQRLMVGARGAGVDACRLHPARQSSRNDEEVDPLAVVGGHAFILSVPRSDPGVDESIESIEPAVALAPGTDDPIVLCRAPREVEVAHQD